MELSLREGRSDEWVSVKPRILDALATLAVGSQKPLVVPTHLKKERKSCGIIKGSINNAHGDSGTTTVDRGTYRSLED